MCVVETIEANSLGNKGFLRHVARFPIGHGTIWICVGKIAKGRTASKHAEARRESGKRHRRDKVAVAVVDEAEIVVEVVAVLHVSYVAATKI